jgi:hydrogenase maturation protease
VSRPDGPLLVIGVGNVLLRDEGVGVRVAHELDRRAADGAVEVPPGTRVVDGGTLGLDLLPLIDDARGLLLVDAVDLGQSPGSVAVIRGDDLQGVLAGHVSPHQVGVGDLLAVARLMGTLPDAVALVGIQPGEIAIGLELTDVVQAAVPEALRTVLAELDLLARAAAGTGPALDGSVATAPMG